MAGGGFFDIAITGKGAHGARPEESIDPVLVACHIGAALQSIVARNISPREVAVVSVTRILSGDAYNVIPQTAAMGVQHVIAMFGATVLAPLLMGFDPNVAILMSGVGTLIFFVVVGGRVPSYLGSSFAFIGLR